MNYKYQPVYINKPTNCVWDEVNRNFRLPEIGYISEKVVKWDNRFLEMAEMVSTWSRDPSTIVGSVIVDSDNRVISTGYNGFAKSVGDYKERYDVRDIKMKLTLHAENNALLFAKQDLHNCVLYGFPFMPCTQCSSMIIQSGIQRVVSLVTPEHLKERWQADFDLSIQILKEAGVDLWLYKKED